MAFLSSDSAQPLQAGGLDIETSTNIMTVPQMWGTNVLPGNLFYADGFKANNASGGKGGGGKGGGNKTYSANVGIALCRGITSRLAIAYEGTTLHYGESDSDAGWLASVGATMKMGSYPDQTPWDGWAGSYAYAVANYPSISYIAAPNYNLGGSNTPPSFNYLIQSDPACFAPWSSVNVGPEGHRVPAGADPGLVFNDLINGDEAAGRGFPGLVLDASTVLSDFVYDHVGGDNSLQAWCAANGVHFSPTLRDAEKGGSIVDRWAQILNCDIGFWDGMVKLLPRGDTTQSGNGYTYTPDLTPVLALGPDDFVTDDDSMPIQVNRTDPADCFNVVWLEAMNDRNEFSPLPVPARSETDIQNAGGIERPMPNIQAHEITDTVGVAPLLADLILQRQQYIRNTFSFRLTPLLAAILTPGDRVSLTDAESGLVAYVVRITEMEADEHEVVTVTAEDAPQGIGTAVLYASDPGSAVTLDTGATGGPVNPPIIFEAPSTLYSPAELVFVLSGGYGDEANPLWGGCQIWGSVDGTTYAEIGETSAGAAVQGILSTNLAAYGGANPDTTDTLTVDLTMSLGELTSFPVAAAAAGASLCYVDGELLAYETATLVAIDIIAAEIWSVPAAPGPYSVAVNFAADYVTNEGVTDIEGAPLTLVGSAPTAGQYTSDGAGTYGFAAADTGGSVIISYKRTASGYALTGLYRGLYGTAPAAHLAGSQFGFLDSSAAIVKIPLPAAYIGKTVHFKFPSWNTWGTALEDISTVTAYPYTVLGSGYGGGADGVPTAPTGLSATVPAGPGSTVAVVASEALGAGAPVHIWNNSGTANVQKADATDGTKPAQGFVLASVAMGATATIYLPGQNDTALSGLSATTTYFLAVGGGVTTTPPGSTGNLVQSLGITDGSAVLAFAPGFGEVV